MEGKTPARAPNSQPGPAPDRTSPHRQSDEHEHERANSRTVSLSRSKKYDHASRPCWILIVNCLYILKLFLLFWLFVLLLPPFLTPMPYLLLLFKLSLLSAVCCGLATLLFSVLFLLYQRLSNFASPFLSAASPLFRLAPSWYSFSCYCLLSTATPSQLMFRDWLTDCLVH